MKVERVYTRGVVSVPQSSTLDVAAAMMRNHHVGAVLVTEGGEDDDTIVGFLTDRDIVVQAVADGYDPRCISVGQTMSPTVATVREKADLHEALEMMRGGGMRRLAVADTDDRIVGVLSLDDVIDGIAADLTSLAGTVKSGRQREAEDLGMVRVS